MIKKLAVFIVGLAIGIGAAASYQLQFGPLPLRNHAAESVATGTQSTESHAVHATNRSSSAVVALGTIEPKGGIVNVASPLVGHRIEKINVQEGGPANMHDAVVELDKSLDQKELQLVDIQLAEAKERQAAEVERAQQALEAAERGLQILQGGRELDLAVQNARQNVLAAKAKQAATDLNRLRQLRQLSDPPVSDQQVEQQAVLVEVAQAEQQAGDVGVKKLKQTLDFQVTNAEAEQKAAKRMLVLATAGAGIRSLEMQKELTDLKLKQSTITAPITGTVLSIPVHVGEVVTQSPLLRMADLTEIVCKVEVDATDVQRLELGEAAKVACRAFSGPFPETTVSGTIERFGSVVAQASVQPLDPRKPVDRHVVEVIVSLNAEEVLKRIYGTKTPDATALVGLQVEARFDEKTDRAKPSSP